MPIKGREELFRNIIVKIEILQTIEAGSIVQKFEYLGWRVDMGNIREKSIKVGVHLEQ